MIVTHDCDLSCVHKVTDVASGLPVDEELRHKGRTVCHAPSLGCEQLSAFAMCFLPEAPHLHHHLSIRYNEARQCAKCLPFVQYSSKGGNILK